MLIISENSLGIDSPSLKFRGLSKAKSNFLPFIRSRAEWPKKFWLALFFKSVLFCFVFCFCFFLEKSKCNECNSLIFYANLGDA